MTCLSEKGKSRIRCLSTVDSFPRSAAQSTSSMSSPNPVTPRPSPHLTFATNRRPLSIAELADRALHNLWDSSRSLKQWLKAADGFRKAGRSYVDAGDLEAAFVEFAKAATIILEKLPTHKEYYTLLSPTQRHNLGIVSIVYRIYPLVCFPIITMTSFTVFPLLASPALSCLDNIRHPCR